VCFLVGCVADLLRVRAQAVVTAKDVGSVKKSRGIRRVT
jgi:hypothetical protein